SRRSGPVDHDAHLIYRPPDYLARIDESRQHNNSRAVLVIVKNRNAEILQTTLHLETLWRRDILQIDASKHRRYALDGLYNFICILRVEAYGKCVYVRKSLEK